MNPYRSLPSVAKLLEHDAFAGLPHAPLVEAIRDELDMAREWIARGYDHPESELVQDILKRLRNNTPYRNVINATGIVLHTNLGRAPLSETAALAAYNAAKSYVALEIDVESGQRSNRQNPLRPMLAKLTGGESATVVNNCAAATILALRALAKGKEVIVSRGQLVEIGGGFRIPEILAESGAVLREVGTTNITRLDDYRNAITDRTAAIMRIHASNFCIRGHTESVSVADLVTLGVPVIDDVGSGATHDMTAFGFEGEPTIREGLAAGADLVLFSGDKLLGGPQAGIIAGKKAWIERIEKDPLMRAFRCCKMTLAALAATLLQPGDNLPVQRMLQIDQESTIRRASSFANKLSNIENLHVELADGESFAGGGSLADQAIPTVTVAIQHARISESQLAAKLRMNDPAIFVRIHGGKCHIDLRTVFGDQEEAIISAIKACCHC